MAYKNLFIRILTSLFLLSLMVIFINYFEKYLYYLIIIFYLIIVYEIRYIFKIKLSHLLFLIVYVLISLLFILMYFFNFYNKLIFFYFIFIIVCFDTTSYILGSLFGNKKIAPMISPNKTYFGTFAGFFLTLLLSILINHYFYFYNFHTSIFFISLTIFFSFFGDLVESFFKRKSNIKNSSNLLPGHGGFFDRLDGFIMASVFLYFFSYFYG